METFGDTSSDNGGGSRNPRLRTSQVARRAGYSVQQIRVLEAAGVLPPAQRGGNGYRSYGEVHVLAALGYRSLAAGVGPVEAKRLMRVALSRPQPELLELLDAAHARLHRQRQDLALAKRAVADITAEPMDSPVPSDAMSISQLAEALGVRPSTLRHWDAERVVVPQRDAGGRMRTYPPARVRDARITHQLRLAGYRIAVLRELVPRLRTARQGEEVTAALDARDASIAARSRALLDAAAALSALLDGDADPADPAP